MDNYIDPTNAPPGPSPYSNARGLLGGMGMTAAANAWNSWPSLAPNDVPATLPSNYDVTVPKCELWPGVLSLANVDLSFEWVPGPPPDATARLFAELVIGSGDNPTTLDVSGSLAVSDTAVTLSLDVEFAAGSSLGGLVEQIFSAMGVGQLVPEDLLNRAVVAPRGQLTLDFRALAAAGGSPPINSLVPTTWVLSHRFELSFAVGGGGTWDVIPGFLTLAAPVALLVGDQGVWTLHLQERLQLFGAAFVLDIAVPSLTGTVILAASLATGPVEAAPAPVAARAGDAPPPVNTTEALAEAAAAKATAAFTLGGLLAHFGLHDTGGLGAVGVTACAVSFDGSQHAASLSLQFVAAKITLGEFSATMQSLEVGYVGGVGGGVTASLHVSLVVAGTTVELWASHPGPGLGWQFSGSWTAGATPSTLAKLCKDLGVAIPDPLGDLALKSLDVSHDTASGTLHFAVEVDYHTATLVLTFDKCTTGADSTWQMAGTLKLHDVELDVVLVKTTDGGSSEKLLLASLGTTGPGLDLVSALGLFGVPTAGLPAVTVHRAMLVWDSVKPNPAASSAGEEGGVPANNILAAADLDLSIDFSGLRRLPLIGEHLPANSTIGAAVSAAYAKGFDNLPPPEVVPYVPATAPSLSGVARGSLSLSAQVTVGTHRFHLSDPSTGAPTVGPSPTAALVAPPVAPALASPGGLAAQVSWTPVGLHLGAIELRRIGHAMEGQTITILLDGSVTIAVLTLDLMGLGLAYDLATRTPAFAFLGVGFALHKDPLLVSAAFMNIDGDFAGTASVVTSTFGLTALGAFSEIGGTPSVFLYGVLEYPIGGPPFFFVEGLAGGFGINRHLTMPPVSGVSDFPFVKAVSGGTPPSIGPIGSAGETVTDQLTQLHDYISPSRGEMFLAAGVKFNSFKLIDGFVLAIVAFDTVQPSVSIDVLGRATLQIPPKPEPVPLVFIELDLLATFRPMEGVLMVQAALDAASYVITPDAHLTGGLAAGFWFAGEHAGDFVFSVGGYHPAFKVPAHYPVPARLGVDWAVSDCVHATGSMYYALTPQALMMGFGFSLTWHSGPLSAWFDAGLDFLMEFHPPHFDGQGHIEIGASFHTFLGNITVSAGAALHIWGPPFAGEAWAHLGPFHAHVTFGSAPAAPAFTWEEFQEKLLPSSDKWVSATVSRGFVREVTTTETHQSKQRWIQVTAKELSLEIESLLPVGGADMGLALRPCKDANHAPLPWSARLTVTVVNGLGKAVDADFALTTGSKNFPAALWADLAHTDHLIAAPGRITLVPSAPILEGQSCAIPSASLTYTDAAYVQPRPQRADLYPLGFVRTAADRLADRTAVKAALTPVSPGSAPRLGVLTALARALVQPALLPGVADIVGPRAVDAFLFAPRVGSVQNP